MSRVAVCLLFIAIFQNGIIKCLADETTTEGVSKNTEETTTKPTEDEPAKGTEVAAKIEAEDKSGTPKPTSNDIPNEGKAAEPNDSKKEDATEKTAGTDNRNFLPNILKGNSNDQTKGLFNFPKNVLEPVSDVGAKLSEVVSKSINTAKKVAGGTFNLLRTSVNSAFEY